MSLKKVIIVLNLVTLLLQLCQSRPNGGTAINPACDDFMPLHPGFTAQTSPPPFKISFNATSYTPGTLVSVTISKCTSTQYQGFMIQARRAENNKNQDERLGKFNTVVNSKQTCSESTQLITGKNVVRYNVGCLPNFCEDKAVAVTKNSLMPMQGLSHASSDGKDSQTFSWNPPASPVGHVVFRATFLRDFRTFWVDVVSEVLLDTSITTPLDSSSIMPPTSLDAACPAVGPGVTAPAGGSQITTPQPPTPAVAVAGVTVCQNSECGISQSCFSDCENSRTFNVAFKQEGDNGVYTITAKVEYSSGSWVALGFSRDRKMGEDSVTGCAFGSNRKVIVWNGENEGQSTPQQYPDNEVTLTSGAIEDNVLKCTFERKIAGTDRRFDISKQWTLLFARGKASFDGNGELLLSKHDESGTSSSQTFSVNDTVVGSAEQLEFPLIKAHGSLMIGAWIFLASVGIVAARYCKPVWKNLMFSQKVWFQIHRLCMVLVFCTTVAGFVIIFVEIEGWSELNEDKEYLEGHPIMGVIVTALTVLNPVMALFRPHPGTPNRPIFNWVHWFVGTAAHVLGVITIFFGVQLSRADAPDYLIYILAGYVAWQVFVELLLEFVSCYGRKKDRSELYEMNGDGGAKIDLNTENEKATLAKGIIFVIHCFVVAAVAAVVIGLLAVGKRELED